MFLDSDDFYLPEKIVSQIERLQKDDNLDFVASLAYVRYENSVYLGVKKFTTAVLGIKEFFDGQCYSLGSLCIRRRVFQAGLVFYEGDRGRYCEDWSFQFKLLLLNSKHKLIKKPLMVVELREDSHTTLYSQIKLKEISESLLKDLWDNWQSAKKLDVIDISYVLVSAKVKLIVAYAMNGQLKNAFGKIIELKQIGFVKKYFLFFLALIGYFHLGRRGINLLWKQRQKHSFDWHEQTEKVKLYLEKLEN